MRHKGKSSLNLFTIEAGSPFLTVLADRLLDGRLTDGWRLGDDPLALASARIFLPTRRTVRAFGLILTERAGGNATLLPHISALGDADFGEDIVLKDDLSIPLAPPIGAMDRLMALARLIGVWKAQYVEALRARHGEPFVLPSSPADAIWLARELTQLLDEAATEGADWNRLEGLVEEDLAFWWQETLNFLSIIKDSWPQYLHDIERSDRGDFLHKSLMMQVEALKSLPNDVPIVVAGSTGSVPATAALMQLAARRRMGSVVLPGLDMHMPPEAWSHLTGTEDDPTTPAHGQYGLAHLLVKLKARRQDVVELAQPTTMQTERARLVSATMLPAEHTDQWAAMDLGLMAGEALEGVHAIEAANLRQEAQGIAFVLRQALETPDKTTALVTNNRQLAHRVSAELKRFDLLADDSGGQPLSSSLQGVLLQLSARLQRGSWDVIDLLGVLKSPLVHLGMARVRARRAIETFELVALRGGHGKPTPGALLELFETRVAEREQDKRKPNWWAGVGQTRLEEARQLAGRLDEVWVLAHRPEDSIDLAEGVSALVRMLEALAANEQGELDALYGGEAGEVFQAFLREMIAVPACPDLQVGQLDSVLRAAMADVKIKPKMGGHKRVHIFSPMEARLMNVDRVVIGGLNEGSWPMVAETGAFLSRVMRQNLGLGQPERRIGLIAHDFQMAMGASEVFLTRSVRDGDAPANPSRWWQRLQTFIGEAHWQRVTARGQVWLKAALKLDERPDQPFAPRPAPCPPIAVRPQHFSVTEIETLRRDPYAIYARHVLKISPLEPLMQTPGAALRGQLFHDILERFAKEVGEPFGEAALSQLMEIGEAAFDELSLEADVYRLWRSRFDKLATNYLGWEQQRGNIVERIAEARAQAVPVGVSGVRLSGRADRIDRGKSGQVSILDFKTGTGPSKKQANQLLAPQLALEAALYARGAFDGMQAGSLDDLAFVRLKADGSIAYESILTAGKRKLTAPQLAEEAWSRLEVLLGHYGVESNGYLSRALPFKTDSEGNYDHLARMLEWSSGGDGGED